MLEIILGLVIGNLAAKNKKLAFGIGAFVAKNKKTAVLIGLIVGTIGGFIVRHIVVVLGGGLDPFFAVVLVTVEALITVLMAVVIVNVKMRKRLQKTDLARHSR